MRPAAARTRQREPLGTDTERSQAGLDEQPPRGGGGEVVHVRDRLANPRRPFPDLHRQFDVHGRPGPQVRSQPSQHADRVGDMLQHVRADRRVERLGPGRHVVQRVPEPVDAGDRLGHVVDDRAPVPAGGEPGEQPAIAAAEVEHAGIGGQVGGEQLGQRRNAAAVVLRVDRRGRIVGDVDQPPVLRVDLLGRRPGPVGDQPAPLAQPPGRLEPVPIAPKLEQHPQAMPQVLGGGVDLGPRPDAAADLRKPVRTADRAAGRRGHRVSLSYTAATVGRCRSQR